MKKKRHAAVIFPECDDWNDSHCPVLDKFHNDGESEAVIKMKNVIPAKLKYV